MEKQFTAMTLIAPRTFEVQKRAFQPLGPHEVRVRVHLAGVCGTDLAIFEGHYQVPLPLVLGHEFCGVVEEIGSEVPPSWLQRRVVVEINNSCLAYEREDLCPECQHNRPHHCRERTVIGIERADGAFAEVISVPAQNLHPLPDSLSNEVAIFTEPMAAALQTFVQRPIEHGENVVVLGAGRLGLLIIAAARAAGAQVIAVSRSEIRRKFALQFGAHYAMSPSQDLPQHLREICGQQLADVVVDATGNPEGLSEALALVRPLGTICVKTTVGQPSSLDLTKLVVDEIDISSSRCGPFSQAIHFLEQHELPFSQWITETYPLTQLVQAMSQAQQPGKVLIDPLHNT
ncbi:MAG: alcohol dehydrogenase [Deltaproteobacteria bacterium]|nr:alcohol dehydrogenase [Deltaproteobacteria bacterium]MBU48107.1 alcohol dehydrogenase [Deltaproteobacteria bacterium]